MDDHNEEPREDPGEKRRRQNRESQQRCRERRRRQENKSSGSDSGRGSRSPRSACSNSSRGPAGLMFSTDPLVHSFLEDFPETAQRLAAAAAVPVGSLEHMQLLEGYVWSDPASQSSCSSADEQMQFSEDLLFSPLPSTEHDFSDETSISPSTVASSAACSIAASILSSTTQPQCICSHSLMPDLSLSPLLSLPDGAHSSSQNNHLCQAGTGRMDGLTGHGHPALGQLDQMYAAGLPQAGSVPWNKYPSTKSSAELSIAEVESLYEIGVKIGILQSNSQVQAYLRSMRERYEAIAGLETSCTILGGSDLGGEM